MLDFDGLNRALLAKAREILPALLPNGKFRGHEYCCASILGGDGDSFKVNIETGKWAEFSGDDRGHDLISLYAKINEISNGEAFRQLSEIYGFDDSPRQLPPAPPTSPIVKPPANTAPPTMQHFKFGDASATWCYLDSDGLPIHFEARYDLADGSKQIIPWCWNGKRWVAQSFPVPRPLYGLRELQENRPDMPVLIVEGCKAADAAKELLGKYYSVISWGGGCNSVLKSDWSKIYGLKILIFPDADEPGMTAAYMIAAILTPHCSYIKIISTLGAIA